MRRDEVITRRQRKELEGAIRRDFLSGFRECEVHGQKEPGEE